MNYKFSNLLGGTYRGGDLLFHGTELLSPVGNRVHQVELTASTSATLPFEAGRQLRCLALSPSGSLLVAVDEAGRSLLVHRTRRVVLHHFSFKEAVAVVRFSPDGRFIAAGVGRLLQVWHTPGLAKSMAPMCLHRTYGHFHARVTAINWAPDSRWLAAGSADLTARVFSVDPIDGFGSPPCLAGHKEQVVGVYWAGPGAADAAAVAGKAPPTLYTVGRDGALFSWGFTPAAAATAAAADAADEAADGGDAQAGGEGGAAKRRRIGGGGDPDIVQTRTYAHGTWALQERQFLWQRGASVTAAAFHARSGVLVLAYSSGLFDMYQLPEAQHLQSLSISREAITSVAFNDSGEWLALGAAALGQLLVWEWRSETYVLKQQGHYFDVSSCAYSPDGAYLVTGADDAKVKVWNLLSGFCFVTFTDHTAPVTGVTFLPSGHAVVSASLDGSVRCFDLVRYRCFRTLTAPNPVQFGCVAVDGAGEVVVAGGMDTFSIYVWSVKTGRLLDVMAGHEGPVQQLAFNPALPMLASCSWDKTVRTWDVFGGKGGVEVLQHSHDVLAVAFHPAGRQLAAAQLDGQIWFWDPQEAVLQGTIEGRRDIAGGRSMNDRRSAGNSTSGQCFTTLQYSADGAFLLAAGASKWVCMYDVAERVLLRRVQLSANQSLDGVLDVLNSKQMSDAGPLGLLQDVGEEDGDTGLLPPTTAGGAAGVHELPGTGGKKRPAVRARGVALAPTGRAFAAAATEGVLVYSVDDAMLFDPTDLTEEVTPAAVGKALAAGAYLRALLFALRLNDAGEVAGVLLGTPLGQVAAVVQGLPAAHVPQVLVVLADQLGQSAHAEFLLQWVAALAKRHGMALQAAAAGGSAARVLPALRAIQKAVTRLHEDLGGLASGNLYTLRYLASAPLAPAVDGGEE